MHFFVQKNLNGYLLKQKGLKYRTNFFIYLTTI